MTQVLNLSRLLEEATYTTVSNKRAIGSFQSLPELLDSAAALQAQHRGLFAYLAFHPLQDPAVAEYIQNGSIGSDAGFRVMVLLLASKPCDVIENLKPSLMMGSVAVNYATDPAYQLVERVFPQDPVPNLPGLMFFDDLRGIGHAVYISLALHDAARDVGEVCRKCFSFAEVAFAERQSTLWTDTLAAKLKAQGIPFQRSGAMHGREWLAHALSLGGQLGASMVSLVPKVAEKLLGLS